MVVTRLLFRDGIQLNGLPASPTETHRRLFALPPCRSAVSPLPSSILNDLAHIIVLSRMDVPFLLWSQDSRLASLRALQFCAVGGVSSNACAFESRPPAHQPMRYLEVVGNKNFGARVCRIREGRVIEFLWQQSRFSRSRRCRRSCRPHVPSPRSNL